MGRLILFGFSAAVHAYAGLRRLKNLWVYTSRGTGYWGPPNRFEIPSEITLLRLVPVG